GRRGGGPGAPRRGRGAGGGAPGPASRRGTATGTGPGAAARAPARSRSRTRTRTPRPVHPRPPRSVAAATSVRRGVERHGQRPGAATTIRGSDRDPTRGALGGGRAPRGDARAALARRRLARGFRARLGPADRLGTRARIPSGIGTPLRTATRNRSAGADPGPWSRIPRALRTRPASEPDSAISD